MNILLVITILSVTLHCYHCASDNAKVVKPNQLRKEKLTDYAKYIDRHMALIVSLKSPVIKSPEVSSGRQDDILTNPYSQETVLKNLEQKNQFKSPSSQNVVLKRGLSTSDRYVYRSLTSGKSGVKLLYGEPLSERRKRAVQNFTIRWDNVVPYVIDPSYSGQASGAYYVTVLKRAIKYIMDRVCVTYVDETARWNSSVPNWFTLNGYKNNGFLKVALGTGCAADAGPGNGNQSRIIYPCSDYYINIHEWLHTLGGAHVQQGPIRNNYISVNYDDITPSLQYSYNAYYWTSTSYNSVNYFFDPASVLMYDAGTWSRNSLETYTPIRDDIFQPNFSPSTDDVNFLELNQVFQCNALFCGNVSVDCGLGYYALYKGVCRCVCPGEYDPATNCQTLLNGPSTVVSWPNTPIVLIAGGPNNTCPTGFDQTPGWFSFTGNSSLTQSTAAPPVKFPVSGKTHFTPLCTKSTPANPTAADWESWPGGGQYCFIKPLNVNCGGAFIQAGAEFRSLAAVTTNGSLGETYYNATSMNITQYYCCRYQEGTTFPIDLPNADPFRLFIRGTSCPVIRGLKSTYTRLNLWTGINREIVTSKSPFWMYSNAMTTFQCYYQPPVYGCNQVITLDANVRSATVTTPGFPTARTPNRRCFYSFNVPAQSQILITFNTCDLSTTNDDTIIIKRYHQWQEGLKLDVTNCPSQVLSVKDYLNIEYWSGFDTVTNKGLNFTATVILPSDQCYDVSVNGADYIGDTRVTETYEPCLPWTQTMDCNDYPSSEAFYLGQSDNKCRNPSGALLQPWCYTYKNGTNCNKRYCDVCNIKAPIDILKNCAALISADSTFCSTSYQRLGCFKSCGLSQVTPPSGTCAPPTIPSDGLLVSTLKSSYRVGERAVIRCTQFTGSTDNVITCTPSGWTNLTKACIDCPYGWVIYGDRCFRYFPFLRNYTAAQSYCALYGSSGVLFEVRDVSDQQTIRNYKLLMGSSYYAANFISGRLDSGTGNWLFSDSNAPMSYYNWSSSNVTKDSTSDCIVLLAENDINYPGGWTTVDCEGTNTSRFMCQLDRAGLCIDLIDNCEALMTTNPGFCSGSQTSLYSDLYCSKSCGDCQGLPNCTAPTSSSYSRTSALASVYPGGFMTFECNAGYYYISGDKKRACSSSGTLLGSELVCQTTPIATDIGLNNVIRRLTTVTLKQVIVLDKTGLRVPFNGKIVAWYYYCKKAGLVSFLVYRKTGTSYTFVGANNVTCDADFKLSTKVDAASQISVLTDDVIGVYTTVASLAASDCSTSDKICNYPSVAAASWTEVQTKAISTTSCMCLSFGARVSPS
ncbi:uncharacterized protein LOC106053522 isoform X2 [Biomphalaria glabrata]|uniref:Uncharacterized protein LOC106053522 isoform X2 n=1 Tax=Biomphalaria glabrata TaxID=6526 RepID=A0A9W2YCM0_BIOGL|nr:uncharacterized protein LOC106053522 isoform X2 [Biomphalaria glabrata]